MKKEYCAVRKLQASPQGSKKLHKAAKEGKLNVVKALIEDRQHNPMEMDEAESTALHHAAQGGHKDIFEYLVQEQDCNPSCSGPCSITPLHLAACNNHLEVVQFLVEKQGMDPMCRTETGRTPLHFACQSGDAMIVTYLIHEIRKFLPICLLLVERTIEGHTPLHIAAHYGHLSLIQLLISRYNCDSSISGQHGRYPIHHAAIEGHLDIVKYLIDIENCESSCIDEFKSTPLHLASSRGHLDIVKYLILNKQCDPYGVDSNKRTPFEVAAQNNQIEVIRFFVEEISFLVDITKAIVAGSVVGHKATQYVSCCLRLFSASSAGHLDRVKKLVELEDCDMYQTLSNGRTIIHYASEGCHLDVLKYYVDVLLIVSRVWNELRTSNLHQYESLDLKKLSEYCLNCICMVSILVGNRYPKTTHFTASSFTRLALPIIQLFHHSTIPPFHHSTIPPFHYSIPPFHVPLNLDTPHKI